MLMKVRYVIMVEIMVGCWKKWFMGDFSESVSEVKYSVFMRMVRLVRYMVSWLRLFRMLLLCVSRWLMVMLVCVMKVN